MAMASAACSGRTSRTQIQTPRIAYTTASPGMNRNNRTVSTSQATAKPMIISTGMSTMAALAAGADLFNMGGLLDALKVFDFGKAVTDDEIAQMLKRAKRGFELDDKELVELLVEHQSRLHLPQPRADKSSPDRHTACCWFRHRLGHARPPAARWR